MKQFPFILILLLIFLLIYIAGYAAPPDALALDGAGAYDVNAEDRNAAAEDLDEEWDEDGAEIIVPDPLEGYNRMVYAFNDTFYFSFLKPVAQAYAAVIPERIRTGIKNIFFNVGFPVRFVNNLLQAKIEAAGFETLRFLVDTSFGGLGFFKPSRNFPALNQPDEDTGQTFGVWGAGNGFYIVWPFLGPSTLRDSVGLVPDVLLHPFTYIRPLYVPIAIRACAGLNRTSLAIGDYEALKEASLDPYTAVKDAYIQNRDKELSR